MKNVEPVEKQNLKHLQMFCYLIPVIGFFPSLWTLYHYGNRRSKCRGDLLLHPSVTESSDPMKPDQASREQLAVSRLSVTLAGTWLMGYFSLGVGASTTEFLTLRLLMLNSLLTSGYFLVSIWLMVRLSSRKSVRLPGFSRLAERVVGKHVS